MPDCVFEELSPHVDRFTPDDRTDRPALGAVHGERGTLLVEGGASVAHLGAFAAELAARGRPPVVGIALTHWHWDHSFGSAAIAAPVIAHRDTAAALAVQAGYDWSDAALAERVRDGREIAFCAEFLRLELPDRSDLEIVVPTDTFAERRDIDLGGVEAALVHVGGDHAADSVAVHVPADGVLFLGDCLYQRLYAPEPLLTIAGVRALLARAGRLRGGAGRRGARGRRAGRRRLRRTPGRSAARDRPGAGARRRPPPGRRRTTRIWPSSSASSWSARA